jgi:hypothetical protein
MNGGSYGQTCSRSTVVNSGITASSRNKLLCARESDVQRELCAIDHLNECAYLVNDRDVFAVLTLQFYVKSSLRVAK